MTIYRPPKSKAYRRRRRERLMPLPPGVLKCEGYTVRISKLPFFEYKFIKHFEADAEAFIKMYSHDDEDKAYENMLNRNPMIYGTPGSERRMLADSVAHSHRQWKREVVEFGVDGVHPEYSYMEFQLDVAMSCVGTRAYNVPYSIILSTIEEQEKMNVHGVV